MKKEGTARSLANPRGGGKGGGRECRVVGSPSMDRDALLALMADLESDRVERIFTERPVAPARIWDARPCYAASLDDLALDQLSRNGSPEPRFDLGTSHFLVMVGRRE